MHLIHLKLAFCSESASAVECSVLAFASNARLSFVYNKNSNHQHVCFCKSNLQEPTLHEKKPTFDCLFIVLVVTGFFTQPLYLTIFIPTIHRWKRPLPETKHIVSIQMIKDEMKPVFLLICANDNMQSHKMIVKIKGETILLSSTQSICSIFISMSIPDFFSLSISFFSWKLLSLSNYAIHHIFKWRFLKIFSNSTFARSSAMSRPKSMLFLAARHFESMKFTNTPATTNNKQVH